MSQKQLRTNFNQQYNSTTSSATSNKGSYFTAQVTRTHNEDPELPHGSIMFRKLGSSVEVSSDFALPYFQFLQNVPLIDEYVIILLSAGETHTEPQSYYLPAVNVWNHPHHGGRGVGNNTPRLGSGFAEALDVNPMRSFPGDIILEGRRGQSIRFSESTSQTPWRSDTNHQPVILISNGQIKTEEGYSTIQEDINEDPASIYLTSHHQIPLEVTQKWVKFENGKRYSSYLPGNEPLEASSYLGNQVLLNSGRVYINSNKEHVLISAADKVGILGSNINIDGDKTITFEAPTINLTGDSLDPTVAQSAIRGDDLVLELTNLYKRLADLSTTLQLVFTTLKIPSNEAAELFTLVNKQGVAKQELEKLLSKRVKLS